MGEFLKPPHGEPLPQLHQEKDAIRREVGFLSDRERGAYLGVLTNSNVDIVSSLYPGIADGMLCIYDFVEKEATDPLSPQGFVNRHIRNLFMLGTILSNAEVAELRERMVRGDYSEQFDVYRRFRQAAGSALRGGVSKKKERFDEYRPVHGDEDIVFNKRACLARVEGLRSDLHTVYGEVDYRRALLTELVLSAPFLETVINGEPANDAQKRHSAYLDEVTEFAGNFDLDRRVKTFEEATDRHPIRWTYEPTAYDVPPFDKKYIEQVYELAGNMMDGRVDLDKIYKTLSETILRRGKVFKASTVHTPVGLQVRILPEQPRKAFFEDIAGYDDQKRFLQVLLAKTGLKDPTVDDIRIVISAGRPGLGKSLGVDAFLNALPDNAKGVVVSVDQELAQRGEMLEYDTLMRLARLHPELHIFTVIEDIDTFAGDRFHFAATRKFLEIDSVTSGTVPRNFHLIATTNRPDVIDPAITRPGRSAKILVYREPDQETRKKIVQVHSQKNNYALSEEILNSIANKTEGFTPDEIRYILWSLRFEDIDNPADQDIEKAIDEIHNRHKIEKEARKFGQRQQRQR